MALLEVENLKTHFFGRRGVTKAVDGVELLGREGRDRRHRRRERLRQVGDLALGPAPGRRARAHRRRHRSGSKGATCSKLSERGDAPTARAPHLDDLPGAGDLDEPGAQGRLPDRRGDPEPRERDERRGAAPDARADGPGRDPGRQAAHRSVPAPVQRRDAAAADDRDGVGAVAGAAGRRRAGHRARRHHPGADPRPAQGPPRPHRGRGAAHHPRHGRGGRDLRPGAGHVPRARGRGGAGRRPVRRAAPPLHARAAGLDPEDRREGRVARGDPGIGAEPARRAARVPLLEPLPQGDGRLPHRGAAAAHARAGPPRRLLPVRRRRRPRPRGGSDRG